MNTDRAFPPRPVRPSRLVTLSAATLLVATAACALLAAPTEWTMGDAQRIVYVHVAVAWLGLASFLIMAGAGVGYLLRRNLAFDHWAQAAAELGWLACGLTVVTGSLWAHEAWGTWWTWDPRLTSAFVLWMLYSGCLIVRHQTEEPHRRARLAGVLSVIGAIDVPMVILATRWFRGMHPVSPEMEPAMRAVLILSVVSFSAVFALLLFRRQRQLRDLHAVECYELATEPAGSGNCIE